MASETREQVVERLVSAKNLEITKGWRSWTLADVTEVVRSAYLAAQQAERERCCKRAEAGLRDGGESAESEQSEQCDWVVHDGENGMARCYLEKAHRGRHSPQNFGAGISGTNNTYRPLAETYDLLTASAALEKAAEEAARWLDYSDAVKAFDDIADWYHAETGKWRPGRSVPLACNYARTDEERGQLFSKWCTDKREHILAALRSALEQVRKAKGRA